jgi:hypothetical protein
MIMLSSNISNVEPFQSLIRDFPVPLKNIKHYDRNQLISYGLTETPLHVIASIRQETEQYGIHFNYQ